MEIVPALFITAFIKKAVDLLKYGTNADWNGVLTQLVAWASGVAVTFAVAHSDFGTWSVNGMVLSSLNGWSLVMAGIASASAAGFGWDALKSIDNHDTSSMPPLTPAVPPREEPILPAT